MSVVRTPPRARVLVCDDDRVFARSLAEYLSARGYDAHWAVDPASALAHLAEAETAGDPVELMLSDVNMPEQDGFSLLEKVATRHPDVSVVLISGYASVSDAVKAIRAGAADYLAKPIVNAELEQAMDRALRQRALLSENRRLKDQLGQSQGLRGLVGQDPRMRTVVDMVRAAAPSSATVLMYGESGTGKSLVARAVHDLSPRAAGPFVELHCGSIPETLLESELFGHVKGAFTGAEADKQGRFSAADSGTIFIDEINSASQAMQLKLLRVLQERAFEPVGSTETREVDVRVILASNQPLEDMLVDGRFREDLYYRINVVMIELPPLRDRPGDIPMLLRHFSDRYAVEHTKQVVGFDREAMEALERYHFPGNVRELQNIVERCVVLSTSPTITVNDLPEHVRLGEEASSSTGLGRRKRLREDEEWRPMSLADAMRDPERSIILRALRANNWNRTETAEQLEINRTTLYKKMKSLGIDRMAS
ncbi:MAG: sigma-54 dependent transcriptional regulator [Planctomycetota bacterium]